MHSSVDGHLGCFHLLVIMNNAAITSFFLWTYIFLSLGRKIFFDSWKRIVGLYSNSMFKLFRNYQTVFQSGILHTHQQCTRVLISPHPRQYLLVSGFFIIAIRVGMKWYEVHCGFDLHFPDDVEQLFMCLLAILYIFLGEIIISYPLPIF